LGYFDVLNQDDEAADFRLEYRHDGHILWLFRPWLGAEATSDGSAHLLGGVQLDLRLGDHWQVSGQVGLGPYIEGGGKDLGSVFEIRS
ncbi:MAG: acyloxyacyl hydrolase, partial [Desulfuromonadales bacterium]|nr:acyloxyacyl hydrolase [Desulfuromonadales bacterium]